MPSEESAYPRDWLRTDEEVRGSLDAVRGLIQMIRTAKS
jgi:hypothetical protein